MATENTMILYKDIFGREFATPMRTLLPEAAPLPPPIRNFMMNTTFEVYDQNGETQDSWDGESELEVRENVKVYNNYPRYFNPTGCKDNTTSTDGKEPSVTDTYGQCYD